MNNTEKIKLVSILGMIFVSILVIAKIPITLGLDLQGGTRLVLEAQEQEGINLDKDALLGTMEVIRSRIDGLGVSEPNISLKGVKQIAVELPGIKDPDRAIQLIGDTAQLLFVQAEWAPTGIAQLPEDKVALLAGDGAKLDKMIEYDAQGKVVAERPIFLKKQVLAGSDLKSATPGTDQYSRPVVNIEFTTEGAKKFHDVTAQWVNKPLAIVLDNRIISAPNINEPISGGRAQISGHFTPQEMKDLVIKLKAGALPVPVKLVSKTIVGPTLGRDSIEKSKLAGMVGFFLVCLFVVGLYRKAGFLACVGMFLYIVFSVAVLKLCHATLTLTGIAGFILSIGMAVDANIIIFERIKEERRLQKPLLQAIEQGYSRAFMTVVDANLAMLIAAGVLFLLGTGTIKGFAVTLSIGALMSMVTSVFITKFMIERVVKHYGDVLFNERGFYETK